MNRIIRDEYGAALVEFVIVFGVFLILFLGSIDVGFILFQMAWQNKATYIGARVAIVSAPAAPNLTNPDVIWTQTQMQTVLGDPCVDASGIDNGNCPSSTNLVIKCTSTGCTPGTYGFSSANFNAIVSVMTAFYPRVKAANVEIDYRFNGAGFVGRPGGLPMDVTVAITGLKAVSFFLVPGLQIPPFHLPAAATTLPTECMVPNSDSCSI